MRALRFLAEVTDPDGLGWPAVRARCAELDVSIALKSRAYVRPLEALPVLVADVVASKLDAGEDARISIDLHSPGDRFRNPTTETLASFELRQLLANLDESSRARALEET